MPASQCAQAAIAAFEGARKPAKWLNVGGFFFQMTEGLRALAQVADRIGERTGIDGLGTVHEVERRLRQGRNGLVRVADAYKALAESLARIDQQLEQPSRTP
jgi:hypothetical protein